MIMKDMLLAGGKRFLKGFVAGGLAQVMLIVGAGFQFHNMKDIGALLATLFFGFLTGGILAVEKMYNWTPIDSTTPPVQQ